MSMRNKFTRVLFIFLLSGSLCYSQSHDELQLAVTKSNPDTSRVHLLLKLGNYYKFKASKDDGDIELKQGIYYYRQAKTLSEVLQNPILFYKAMQSLGDCYLKCFRLDSGEYYYNAVIDYYHKKGDFNKEASLWENLASPIANLDQAKSIRYHRRAASLYWKAKNGAQAIQQENQVALLQINTGHTDSARYILQQILSKARKIHYQKLYSTYELLAQANKVEGNLSGQLFYLLEMIKNSKQYAPKSDVSIRYYYLEGFYRDWGMYDKALFWIRKSVDGLKYGDPFNFKFEYYEQLVTILLLKNQNKEALAFMSNIMKTNPPVSREDIMEAEYCLGDCYLALNRLSEAEAHYLKALAKHEFLIKHTSFVSLHKDVLINQKLGNYYFRKGDYKKSASYFNRLKSLPPHSIRASLMSSLYLSMFRTDSALHNYGHAIQYYQQYKKISDSLFNIVKSGQVADMQIKYETTQKEQSIKLLRSEGKNQYAQLKTLNLERNITFAGIVMLLVTVGISYRSYRDKQRSNVLLETKQKEINRQNVLLQDMVEQQDGLLMEKDWLLKEVHHRVKNSLQIVMSLLNTQSAFLKNTPAASVLRESQNRVQSIALIHQKLYSSTNAASINIRIYIHDLLLYLKDCYGTDKCRIRVHQEVEDITLDISQAVPLGLILNEAITNAIKYAFSPNGGELTVRFHKTNQDDLVLTVMDNGAGIPEEMLGIPGKSMGMQMMKILSKQLGGNFTITNTPGATLSLQFPMERIAYGNQVIEP